MRRILITGLVLNALALASVAQAAGHAVCRPKLAVTGTQFSR